MALRDNKATTQSGVLEGALSADGKVSVFRGVPFARPPVGALRWRPPQAPQRWDGVRAAKKFAPVCIQAPRPSGSISDFGVETDDEDCLYLNIWSAAEGPGEKRPVMLWVHGGGFSYGSGSLPLFDGAALARRGVVLVTINYRMGPLGFLAHPELSEESPHGVSGNYGFFDQIEALRWVSQNIAAFGGDRDRVTIFGQSVGSSSVSCLLASPLAKGLFHRAICQSGGSLSPLGAPGGGSMQTLVDAHARGVEFLRHHKAACIAEMRARPARPFQLPPADERDDPWAARQINMLLRNSGWVIVDGYAVPTRVHDIFSGGAQNDVPVITGANSHEGSTAPAIANLQEYEAWCRGLYGDAMEELFALYGVRSAPDVADVARRINGHRTFNWQNWTTLRLQARTAKSAAFGYHFRRQQPFPPGARYWDHATEKLGAFHTAEIPYVYDHLAVRDWPWREEDRALANTMSSYWVNFAANGDPNDVGLPIWPRYGATSQEVMIFGDEARAGAMPDQDKFAFWDRFFGKQLHP